MTHSLEDLKSGKLRGTKRLKLACGLKEFPKEILTLAETLEILDLSDNNLSELPDSLAQLKNLKVIFFAKNRFTTFPKVLKECHSLSMIGFKSNQLAVIPEDAFPPLLRWLILTDNKIKKLPKSIGACHLLQKCALAGNLLEELPDEMQNCRNLELLRISANQLKRIPDWLFALPKLSWLAFGGNPAVENLQLSAEIDSFHWDEFSLEELLGEGASGHISKAKWQGKEEAVALKVFKGDVTSDGLPEVEMDLSIAAGFHENLIQVLGKIEAHPEEKPGLIMNLISPNYSNLGNPPSLETCTRDTFTEEHVFTEDELLKLAKSIASVCAQLHSKGIKHGDLYAHNILVNEEAHFILGDFGAASFYDLNSAVADKIERIEVRAFACLLEDISGLVPSREIDPARKFKWQELIADCSLEEVSERPNFAAISEKLKAF